jgi:hypothetical protein
MRHTEDLLLALGGALAVFAAAPQTRDLVPMEFGSHAASAPQADYSCAAQEKEDVLRTLDLDETKLSCTEREHLATAESLLNGR